MSGKAAILIFPGTNSEDETLRMLHAVGVDAYLVHWSRGETLPEYDAYVLPGGFAYEDRIRAGAIPAHDRMMDHVIDGAQRGKLVLGICNGAQILLEAGLVPGTGEVRRAAFTQRWRHFVGKHVRCATVNRLCSPFTARWEERSSAWASRRRSPGRKRRASARDHRGAHVALPTNGRQPPSTARPWSTDPGTCSRSCPTPNATAGTSTTSPRAKAPTPSSRAVEASSLRA